MKTATLIRSYLPDRTVGKLTVHHDNLTLMTLELPDKNNQVNVSCIPAGNYLCKRDYTGKHQFYKVTEVQGRTDIEIHIANKPEDLLGCIGLGLKFNDEYNLMYSKKACNALLESMNNEDFMLCIRDYNSFFDGW